MGVHKKYRRGIKENGKRKEKKSQKNLYKSRR